MTDTLDRALTEALWHMDAAREQAGWDQRADLWLLYREHTGDLEVLTGVEFPGWKVAMKVAGHSYYAMRACLLATIASKDEDGLLRRMIPLEDLVGLVLVDEVWAVLQKPGETPPTGSFAVHPDRVEQRFCWLQTLDGTRAFLIHERDGIARLVEGDDAGDEHWSGRIGEALADLATEIA